MHHPSKVLSAILVLSSLVATPHRLAMAEEAPAGPPGMVQEKAIYRPTNKAFWKQVDELIQKGKAKEIFDFNQPLGGTPEVDEWKLAIGRALFATGYPIHAQYLLSKIASSSVGTRQGFEALKIIEEIGKKEILDELMMEELAFDLDTKIDDSSTNSMIAYYKGRALMRRGYASWASKVIAEVDPQDMWGEELRFDLAQQFLISGDTTTAYERFEELAKKPTVRSKTALMSRLAMARLIFERKDYGAAISAYREIELPTRERARSLNELAWSYYYDKAFGKSLGTIQALKSAYFKPLLSPETLLLEMLIYRELCQYRTVKELSGEFTQAFAGVYDRIESRQPMDEIPQFLQMLLQEGGMQRRASVIQNIRLERKKISGNSWGDEAFKRQMIDHALSRERLADAEVRRLVKDKIEGMANWFLDLREQVMFLDYEASLKLIQLNEKLSSDYKPPVRQKLTASTLFWPVSDEAWRDELLDYEVLAEGTCQSPGGKSGEAR